MNSRTRTPFGNTPPPPEKCHVTIPAEELKPGRIIIVGDVHGCLDELNALLVKCDYQQDKDNLILAGDIVNKGKQSAEALWRAQELGALVVRGNHEDACVALKQRLSIVSSLASNYKWLKQLTSKDVDYMRDLPFTITLPSHGTCIVHAGLMPNVMSLEEQTMKDMLFLEETVPVGSDSTKPHYKPYYKERPGKKDQAWAHFWQGPHHVFFGHASKDYIQKFSHATGLDTACVHGGKLTACILPSIADLKEYKPYQEYCESHSSKRPPKLEELNAVFEQVDSGSLHQQQDQLQSMPSAGFCTEKFTIPEESTGMQKMPSGPMPETQLLSSIGPLSRAANLTK